MWLLLYDTYSKWGEVINMKNDTTAQATVRAMRRVFCSTGLQRIIVSDNGPQFVSEEFQSFLRRNLVDHILCPSYSPKSNGSCERFVQTFKNSMKKMYETSKDVDLNVASFLLSYRNTPHSVTNQPPAILMYGRTLRSSLNSIRSSDTVEKNALNVENEKMVLGKKRPEIREFVRYQPVWMRVDNSKEYVPAVVKQKTGNWYEVSCRGRALKKHVDAIKGRQVPPIIATKSAEIVTASPEITPNVSTPNTTEHQTRQ